MAPDTALTPSIIVTRDAGFDVVQLSGGTIVVVRRTFRGRSQFAFVRQDRHTLGETLEMPRGGIAPGETHVQCAVRALHEETGYQSSTGLAISLGAVLPDTGFVRADVRAFLLHVAGDPETVDSDIQTEWLTAGDVDGAIIRDTLTCGMSLAAWAKVKARGLHLVP